MPYAGRRMAEENRRPSICCRVTISKIGLHRKRHVFEDLFLRYVSVVTWKSLKVEPLCVIQECDFGVVNEHGRQHNCINPIFPGLQDLQKLKASGIAMRVGTSQGFTEVLAGIHTYGEILLCF